MCVCCMGAHKVKGQLSKGDASNACSTAQLWQDSPPHPHLRTLPDVVAVQWLLFEEGRLDVLRDAMSALTGQPGGRGAAGQLSCHAVSTGRWATGQPGGV